jgi:hypothetical protein
VRRWWGNEDVFFVLGDAFFMTVVNFILSLSRLPLPHACEGSEEHAGLEGKWKNIKDGGKEEETSGN